MKLIQFLNIWWWWNITIEQYEFHPKIRSNPDLKILALSLTEGASIWYLITSEKEMVEAAGFQIVYQQVLKD